MKLSTEFKNNTTKEPIATPNETKVILDLVRLFMQTAPVTTTTTGTAATTVASASQTPNPG